MHRTTLTFGNCYFIQKWFSEMSKNNLVINGRILRCADEEPHIWDKQQILLLFTLRGDSITMQKILSKIYGYGPLDITSRINEEPVDDHPFIIYKDLRNKEKLLYVSIDSRHLTRIPFSIFHNS